MCVAEQVAKQLRKDDIDPEKILNDLVYEYGMEQAGEILDEAETINRKIFS